MSDTNALARALLGYSWPEHDALSPAPPSNPFTTPGISDVIASFAPYSYRNPLFDLPQATPSISDLLTKSYPSAALAPNKLAPVIAPEVKRKVYFAFSFDDIMRVNNVRQVGKIGPREMRNPRAFTDRSIWERRDIRSEEALKTLMRNAMRHSSVVCVLIGSNTWLSRWVKYEIARAVVDDKGLLAVHLNGIDHHVTKAPDRPGINPLHVMGVYRNASDDFYLCEKHAVVSNVATGELGWEWRLYEDYTGPVAKPPYLPMMGFDRILPLSAGAPEYDMVRHDGFKRIGAWIDTAADAVGR
jgi:MTH538 TIR-like domain (DUF1863)